MRPVGRKGRNHGQGVPSLFSCNLVFAKTRAGILPPEIYAWDSFFGIVRFRAHISVHFSPKPYTITLLFQDRRLVGY